MNTRIEKSVHQEKANLLLFLSGKSISLFGSAIYTFALGLYLLKITGSGLTFATNIILYTLPIVIINPFVGVIVDRVSKRMLVIGADVINGIFLLGVYMLAGKIGISVSLIYMSTFFMTIMTVFANVAIEAAKPSLVSAEKLVEINSIGRVVDSASYLVGPMVGGQIYNILDIKMFILINALSFLIAGVLECFINYDYNTTNKEDNLEHTPNESFFHEIKYGYGYIFTRQHMKALVWIFLAQNFFFNYTIIVPMPYLLNNFWNVDPSIYGIVQGGLPAGMIVGAMAVKSIYDRVVYSSLLKVINYSVSIVALFLGLPMILSATPPNEAFVLIYYLILMFINGFIISWIDVPVNILLLQVVPQEILGRVISVVISIIKIIVPIALLVSGHILNQRTPLFLFLSGALIILLFNMVFFASPMGKDFVKISNKQQLKAKEIS